MKKTILTIGTCLTLALTSAFANDNGTATQKAKESFNTQFVGANVVSWQSENELVKATFLMNDQVMFAYYNTDGELVATTRNLLSDDLPINLLTDLKKNHNKGWITDLFEMAANGETNYYVTLENADETLVLKSAGFDSWTVYKRTKKSSI